MSCYLRHLKEIFDEGGIAITPSKRQKIDKAIHKIAGIDYKNCPAVWKLVKEDIKVDGERRRAFIKQLQMAMHEHH